MDNKIKDIVSVFIKVPAEQISHNTIIDRTSVSSSITLHRMYAKLAEEGIVVPDYWNIQKFATLLERVNGNGVSSSPVVESVPTNGYAFPANENTTESAVGIDMEEVDAMPKANDFREAEFYKMNFAATEIAHCILQPNPYASFAGLFAAKEAIVKANNSNRNKPFSAIIIEHDPEGKPTYAGYSLSVSHTNNMAVAVAVQIRGDLLPGKTNDQPAAPPPAGQGMLKWLVIFTFLLSLAALIISLLK